MKLCATCKAPLIIPEFAHTVAKKNTLYCNPCIKIRRHEQNTRASKRYMQNNLERSGYTTRYQTPPTVCRVPGCEIVFYAKYGKKYCLAHR